MRDEQILKLIREEVAHIDNVSLLRTEQVKIRINSIVSALCEPRSIFKIIFNPSGFYKTVDSIYEIKARDFNERLNESITKQRLKI